MKKTVGLNAPSNDDYGKEISGMLARSSLEAHRVSVRTTDQYTWIVQAHSHIELNEVLYMLCDEIPIKPL